MSETHQTELAESLDRPLSISHVVHKIRAYRSLILLSWAVVALGYAILAIVLYLLAPSQRITSQHFRINFEGVGEGHYPNGTRFSTAEIVGTTILDKVYRGNHLEQFVPFSDFSHAVFVLEANEGYERLAAEYQAKLTDLRITPMDRERIQKEWELKAAAIAKNDYSINYIRGKNMASLPDSVTRKVLLDVLNAWADHAMHEKHAFKYQISILSANALQAGTMNDEDFIVRLQILRSKIVRIMANIDELALIPAAPLTRTEKDGLSLQEIRMRLEEIVRFRLEPLNGIVRASGLIKNPATTLRFLESQLAYDQRELKSRQEMVDTIRESIAVYAGNGRALVPEAMQSASEATAPRPKGLGTPNGGETVMPQFTDTFIDRLVTLAHQSGDMEYRQRLVDDYRRQSSITVPSQTEVEYDQQVLNLVKAAPAGPATATLATQVSTEIEQSEAEVRKLVGQVDEIYEIVSRNLNPTTELLSLTSPPTTRNERAMTIQKLGLYGVLVMLMSLPVIVIACLLHARVREEEETEGYVGEGAAT